MHSSGSPLRCSSVKAAGICSTSRTDTEVPAWKSAVGVRLHSIPHQRHHCRLLPVHVHPRRAVNLTQCKCDSFSARPSPSGFVVHLDVVQVVHSRRKPGGLYIAKQVGYTPLSCCVTSSRVRRELSCSRKERFSRMPLMKNCVKGCTSRTAQTHKSKPSASVRALVLV